MSHNSKHLSTVNIQGTIICSGAKIAIKAYLDILNTTEHTLQF